MADKQTIAPAGAPTSGAGRTTTTRTSARWVSRWGYEIGPKATLKGVFRLREGGFLCRSQVQDHSGKERTIFKVLREAPTADAAREWLVAEIRRIKAAPAQEATKGPPAFADYALSLAERKVREGTIKSAHSREVLASILEHHLIPFFGEMPVDKIRRADVIRWKDGVASRIQAGEVSPHTANGWWSVLRATINAAVAEHELERNPVAKVEPFDTSEHPAHTREDPNSLTPEEFGAFVTKLRELFPQHHAMALLGFVTGLRPSSLRPLRRHGEHADVLWDEGALLIRRSHTRRDEVMRTTKTGFRQRIGLPPAMIEALRAHVDSLPPGPMLDSELLFPSVTGGFRAPSVLDKPFKRVAKAIGLRKRITAKGMRRTFQDLTRAESVNDLVVRSISGHVTREMHEHYSTPLEVEQRDGIARVIRLANPKAQPPAAPPAEPAAAKDATDNPTPASNSRAKG